MGQTLLFIAAISEHYPIHPTILQLLSEIAILFMGNTAFQLVLFWSTYYFDG